MTPQSLAYVLCRVLAVWFGVRAVHGVGTYLMYGPMPAQIAGEVDLLNELRSLGPAIFSLVAAVVLFQFASLWSRIIAAGAPESVECPASVTSRRSWMWMAAGLVGLYEVVWAVPAVLATGLTWFWINAGQPPEAVQTAFQEDSKYLLYQALCSAAGVILIAVAAVQMRRIEPNGSPAESD